MKTDDYKKANCSLLRSPPIDISVVENDITLALVKAWEEGSSVNYTIKSVLNDKKILKKLTEQISENMEFQRATTLHTLDEEKKRNIQSYEAERESKIQYAQESLGYVVSEKESELKEAGYKLSEKHSDYNVNQKRLEEMRTRIQEKLKSIGGKEGLETLMTIHNLVKSPQDAQSMQQGYIAKKPVIYDLDKAVKLATAKEQVDPLRGKTLEDVMKSEEKPRGKVYRFFQKVWRRVRYGI